MNIEFLDSTKKKKILSILDENYGINNLPFLLLKTGNEKVRAYSGDLSKDEINTLSKDIKIELIGTQLCSFSDNEHLRLNFDVMNLPIIKSQITKNTLNIDKTQLIALMNGKNLEIPSPFNSPFLPTKFENDFFGIIKNRNNFLQNYIPKEKRMKID